MILHNLSLLPGDRLISLEIEGSKIKSVLEPVASKAEGLKFDGALVFPGLINSHDHLDFNLFPQTGNKIYSNYAEWGKDIHIKNKQVIEAVLKIPQELRIQWGIYKNLLNGVTTVVNHGPRIAADNDLIRVYQDTHSLHSVMFEKHWKLRLNNPFSARRS